MGTAMATVSPAVTGGPAAGLDPAYRNGLKAALMFGPIASDIAEAERIFDRTLAPHKGPFGPLVEHLRHYRGKRLRPALLLLTAEACGGVAPAHHTLAAAMEMIHTATLVHDDVLDEADVRRHAPTFRAGWGNKVSILLGDMLFTHAFHLTSTVDGRACQITGEVTNRVCAGELRQVTERGNLELSEADYFAVIDGKTAALTECCGRLGALYAGASEEVAAKMASYGRSVGLAFQIADDLLDLTGTEEAAGKTLGTDLEQQKLTLPVIHCLNRLPAGEAAKLRDLIRAGGEGLGARVLQALEKTQSVTYAKRRAEELSRSARQELECLPRGDARSILEAVTEWSIRREK
ncbi:Octaprenyl-diphosphate synthase [Gemmata obscuriglobus]|nr:Octaprenyl-diphosphate synthase [Gemmata obscuriglobus]VTS11386.1 polyprenyl synthetase : Geranylgeranyl pyrophosphate synthase OS=Singulisphaera acidiphila (strain ATCC BAA-1392 / DSM 18658 / VKM B-2454 / MOB10) GN=Sinac_2664 PE=3 SV=1: polyprenyl_synt [Gemmata obscuriglobus UQM 2246]